MAAEAAPAAEPSPEGLGETEDTGAGGNTAATAAAAAARTAAAAASGPAQPRVYMLLVPPQDAPVIIIQRLVRGRLTRETYRALKVCTKNQQQEKLLLAGNTFTVFAVLFGPTGVEV